MRVGKRAWYTGAAVALVVALGGLGSSAVTPIDRAAFRTTLCAEFTDTVGLYRGNDVTVLGVRIGIVDRIESLGDRMRVRMKIDGSVPLSADVGAVTVAGSVVTDRHVELIRARLDGPRFDQGRCIPLSRTRTPRGISESFDAMGTLAGQLTGGGADHLLGDTLMGLDRATQGTGPAVNSLLGRLSTLVGDPTNRDTQLRRAIDNLDTLTTMFTADWPDMRRLLDTLYDGISVVDVLSENFAPMIDRSNELVPVLARNIDKYGPRIFAVLDLLLPVVRQSLHTVGDIRDLLAQIAKGAR